MKIELTCEQKTKLLSFLGYRKAAKKNLYYINGCWVSPNSFNPDTSVLLQALDIIEKKTLTKLTSIGTSYMFHISRNGKADISYTDNSRDNAWLKGIIMYIEQLNS